ncbi:MAG TPA: hypothetical protein VNM67_04315 [Thermoanaerobaculia bacterium]|jgi:hypothetical protein|nr:hypothetical protein [Thermoanaerobaculia bacterium]
MRTTSFHLKVVLLLLLLVLAAPWASAAGPGQDGARPASAADSPLVLLGRFWDFLRSAWSEEGCHIDPDGRCVPAPRPQADTGCHIDPSGGCRP